MTEYLHSAALVTIDFEGLTVTLLALFFLALTLVAIYNRKK